MPPAASCLHEHVHKTLWWLFVVFPAVSVGVSCFTLVTISSERYFAIVEPLRSRRWQTRSHSYKCIMGIWLLAFILMIPIAASQEVIQIRNSDRYSCREIWSRALRDVEILYSVSLCVILFVIPMFVMMLAYGRIAYRLWADINQQVNDTTGTSSSLWMLCKMCVEICLGTHVYPQYQLNPVISINFIYTGITCSMALPRLIG